VEGGRARLRTIELGRRNATDAEALSGLEDGDEDIVHPGDTIQDGTRVTKRKE
jgi:HlyD family secretion protein